MFKAGRPMVYYKHKIDRKDEFIDVLKRYLSPECIREIPYLSKRPRSNGSKHMLLFSLLDMSYEDEILEFGGQIMRDVSELVDDEPPAIKIALFKYNPAHKKNKNTALEKKKAELKRWLENPDDFIDTYEPRDEIEDEVLVDEEKRGDQHVLVKDGQFLNVCDGDDWRDSPGYSFMFINDYDFSYTHMRKVKSRKGVEEKSYKKYYKKDGDNYYSWRSVHARDLKLVPSRTHVGFFYYEGKPRCRIQLNKETYYKYLALAEGL